MYFFNFSFGKVYGVVNAMLVVEDVLDYFYPEPPRWDPEFCGDHLTLGDGNRSVTLNAVRTIGSVQSAPPCSIYSVRVLSRYILIGFAPRHGFQKNRANYRSCGWFLEFGMDGRLYSQDGTHGKSYATNCIRLGSVVTAIHDMSQDTIEFQVDGKSLGIAFTNIPHEKLYAAADLFGAMYGELPSSLVVET
jgi:hypothetical protein